MEAKKISHGRPGIAGIPALIRSERLKRLFAGLLPLFGLIILIVFFQIVSKGALLQPKSIKNMANQSFAVLVSSAAAVFVMATGNLDFSIGASVGFCGTVACFAAFINPFFAPVAAILAGVLIGSINGSVSVYLKIPSFIVCLCMMFILTAATETLTGGTTKMIPISMMNWDNNTAKLIFGIVYFLAIILIFEFSKAGKHLKAIGISGETARLSGVKTGLSTFLAYVISGLASGIAGFFLILRAGAASPRMGTTMTTDVIIAIVLGGMTIQGGASSKIFAAIIGTLMITVLNSGIILAGMGGDAQQLFKGLIFIAVVAVSSRRSKNAIVK